MTMPTPTGNPPKLDIPEFKEIVLYTGNVMRTSVAGQTKTLSKKSNAEIINAIADTLHTSLHKPDRPSFRYYPEASLLEVPDLRLSSRIAPDDRDDVEVTAKLFYLDNLETLYQASYIESAVSHLQKLLGVQEIDTFILSFKNSPTSSLLKTAWKRLEQQRESGRLIRLGVAEFSYEELDAILSDPSITVKPVVNQINVDQCCKMPSQLIELAKRHNVELLHNGDCSDFLSSETFTDLLRQNQVVDGTTTVAPRFVLKYHVFVKCRSVVADKGYIVVGDASSA
ncbi:hypothetical protein VTP01DRAFT_7536 [Rhizomucor pusillus]|uniref:uncharacterized protein n=1 Tax=Rhizomucor pusillus TaxID=4840 RepID=UPI003742F7D1